MKNVQITIIYYNIYVIIYILHNTNPFKIHFPYVNMEIGVKVGDVMTRNFISVKPDDSLKKCSKLMVKKRIGSLVVISKNELTGLITEKDILWTITKKSIKDLEEIKAKDIAKRKVITIRPSADIYDALKKMKKSKYRWLPVTRKKEVIGLLTLKDILKIEPSLFEIVYSQGKFGENIT